jgi:anti-anti-sigma factor
MRAAQPPQFKMINLSPIVFYRRHRALRSRRLSSSHVFRGRKAAADRDGGLAMEHRLDLEQLLLDGLPDAERRQVRRVIAETDAALRRRKATAGPSRPRLGRPIQHRTQVDAQEPSGHRIAFGVRDGGTLIRLMGDIDLMAETDLNWVLESLHRLGVPPVKVDLSEVWFMDTSGLRPLIEATRHRRADGLEPLLVGPCSPPVMHLLNAIGVAADPVLDVDAWDLLACSGKSPRKASARPLHSG